jgi:hypothetical protein
MRKCPENYYYRFPLFDCLFLLIGALLASFTRMCMSHSECLPVKFVAMYRHRWPSEVTAVHWKRSLLPWVIEYLRRLFSTNSKTCATTSVFNPQDHFQLLTLTRSARLSPVPPLALNAK